MNSREKGKRGEREAAKAWKEAGLPGRPRRGQQYSGVEGKDLVFGFGATAVHVEVKRCEKLALYDALEQAKRDAREDHTPVVLHKRNRKPWLLIVELEQVPRFVAELAWVKAQDPYTDKE